MSISQEGNKGARSVYIPFISFLTDAKSSPPRIDEIGRYTQENAHNPERKIGARRITVPAIKVAGIYYRHG
nr:Uncharacterised protein [Escherichia coli]